MVLDRIAIPERFLHHDGRMNRSVACDNLSASQECLEMERPGSHCSNSSSNSNLRSQAACTQFGELALAAVL